MNFRPGHVDATVVAMRTVDWWAAQPLDDEGDKAVAARIVEVLEPWAISDTPMTLTDEPLDGFCCGGSR